MNDVVLVSLIVSALGTVACAQSRDPERSLESARVEPSAAPVVRANKAVPRAPIWETGQHYRYQLKTTSLVAMDQGALYDFDVTGIVDLVLTAREKGTDTFFLTLEAPELKSRVPGSQPEFDKLVPTLKAPFFFDLNAGLVSAGYAPKDLHPLAVAVFRSIASSFQVASNSGAAETFRATEYDTTGQYEAEYSPTVDSLGWHKRKQRYFGILLPENHSKDADRIVPHIEKSEGLLRLGPGDRLTDVDLLDELSFSNAQAPMRSRVHVSLVLQGTKALGKQEPVWASLKSAAVRLPAQAPYESNLGDGSLEAAKIRGLTFDVLLGKFENLASHPKPKPADPANAQASAEQRAQTEEENRLFVALGAVLRSQPQSVARAVSSIRSNSTASDVLIDGLGNAGSPEAQAALVQFARGKTYSDTRRNRAAIALSRTEHPTVDSLNALFSLVDDEIVGTQALYGLGTYCSGFQEAGRADVSAKIGDFLMRRLSRARSELRVVESLRAIANSAYLPALPAIQPYLSDPRVLVRVDAVRALQLMPSTAVDSVIAERLLSDSATKVKLAAIEAMDERTPTDALVTALRAAARLDDPHVRYRSVEMMVRWLPKRTELRDELRAVAKNEQEPKIRELAGAAL